MDAHSGFGRRAACLAFLLSVPSFGQIAGHQPLATPDDFKQLRAAWASNLHDKKVDASVATYAADAEFIQPDGSRVRRIDALRKLYETITAKYDSDLTFDSQRVETSGSLTYDTGTYRETLVDRSSGKLLHSSGSYLTIYRRVASGQWLIVEQVWTGSVQ